MSRNDPREVVIPLGPEADRIFRMVDELVDQMQADIQPLVNHANYLGASFEVMHAEAAAAESTGRRRRRALQRAKRARADMTNYARQMREGNEADDR